jgi:branched-chain amino acid transport system permease protein
LRNRGRPRDQARRPLLHRDRFALQEWLADLGTWYLIILGVLAILITIRMPNGLWGWFTERTGVSLFPVGRRLEVERE